MPRIELLEKFKLYRGLAEVLLSGQKLDSAMMPSGFTETLMAFLTRMHAGFFTAYEAQSLIELPEHEGVNRKFMGNSSIHVPFEALFQQADALKQAVLDQGENVCDFEVLGVHRERRLGWRWGEFANIPDGKVAVLTKGDLASLWQAMALLVERMEDEASFVESQRPVIIQNPEFWTEIFGDVSDDPDRLSYLQAYGVHFSQNASQTAELLAELDFGPKIKPAEVYLPLSDQQDEVCSGNIFGTTDTIKSGQIKEASERKFGLPLKLAMNVIGRYLIPPEEQYSYAGNAYIKMSNMLTLLKNMGRKDFVERATQFGLDDPLHFNVMTNDGGNAFFMENMEGRRYIDFFSESCFPETVDVMNPIQAGPGVELAPLKQAVGMDTAVTRVFKKAREVCESDPDFTINDLCSFDTSINMSISVGSFFDLFEEMKASGEFESDEDIIHEIAAYHVFAVGSTQKLGLLEDPRYPPNTIEKVAETDHVLLADPEKGLSRAEIPGWYMSGPNVLSFSRLMAQAHGDLPSAELGGPTDKLRRIMIGVPQMLTGPSGTDQYYTMLKHLKDMGVRTRQGPDIWWKYRPDSFVPEKRVGRQSELSLVRSFDMSARVHRAGVKRLLDDSDVLYIPADTELSGGTAELYHYLLTFSGAVRRQLLLESAPLVVMERGPFADKFIEVVKSLKSVGLVGQKIEDIVTLTNGPEESADAIGKYFERFRPRKVEYKEEKRRRSRKHEHRGPYMVTGFGSAKSTHKEFIEKSYQAAYLFAINGMSLKVGGGNDGVMRALAEGFLRGKQVLRERGHMFPNQLILIQCHETESIEGKYIPSSDIQVLKRDIIHYSYPNIEGRRYDLVQTNLAVDFGGGIGTCEEDIDVQIDVASNSVNSAKKKTRRMIFNQTVRGNNGAQVGIWDAYIEHFGHLSSLDTSSVAMTVGELVTQADWHRRTINDERISKRHLFVPSFPLITDPNELPTFAAGNVVSIQPRDMKVA